MFNQNNEAIEDKTVLEARAKLWQMGIVVWKLDVTQKLLYDFYHHINHKVIVVNASRRLGKSFFLLTLALEQCLKFPKSIVKYIQPETGMIRKNLNPDFEQMLQDCPVEMRPKFHTQDNMWVFPNGSKIHLAGTDNGNYDKLRGGNAHLCLIDEAGFCTDLKHIINSILTPLTLLTKGRIVLSSTTPPTPDHEFNEYMEYAEKEGTLIRKTILDAVEDHKQELYPRITEEIVADILKAYPGGVENQAFKTEYLCQKIYNSSDSVIPEFTEEVQRDTIVEWPKPPFVNCYTAMDIGFTDLTVVLFGYWDYDNAVLVIQDEYVVNGPTLTTSTLAEQIKKKEAELWTNKLTREFEAPYKRVSDNNLIVINDLTVDHGLYFQATDKHDKLSYVSLLRTMIENREVIINPRCKTLIMHMRTGTWDKSKKDFKRSADGGHYDALAALLYLSRNIDKTRNPYPNGYRHAQLGSSGNVFIRDSSPADVNKEYQKLEKMFKRKSSFKSGK